ncbi:MAG: glycosyltransferase family 39 protein [Longimicrobiales bacterium]
MDIDSPEGRSISAQEAALITAFGVLIAIGILLRFWRLGEDGLWYDELWTVVGAGQPFPEMVREWILADPHPPGYFLFYFAWLRLTPDNDFWLRLPNAVAGVLTVTYLLFGTRRVLSRDERVYAATLASFSWLYVFYAVNVKQYSATLLLTTVATVAYLEVVTHSHVTRRTALQLGAALIGLAYLDHFGMAYAWLLLGLLAITFRRTPAVLRPIGRIGVIFALAYLPIAYLLRVPLLYSGNDEQSGLGTLLADLMPSLFFDDIGVVAGSLAALGAGFAISTVRGQETGRALRSTRNAHTLGVFASFAALLLAVGLLEPILVVRYFIVLFPVALLGLAILTAAVVPLGRGWMALLPILFFTRAAVVDVRAVDRMQRQAWDESVDLVLAAVQPGDDVYALGAGPDQTMLAHLRAGNVDGAVYSKNADYYRYYFRRRGANDIAARLKVVEPTVASAGELVRRYQHTGSTVYVLAGHHIQFDADAAWALEQAAIGFETTWLYSTIVYQATF